MLGGKLHGANEKEYWERLSKDLKYAGFKSKRDQQKFVVDAMATLAQADSLNDVVQSVFDFCKAMDESDFKLGIDE